MLGCTHYPLVADLIARQFDPTVELIDTSEAIARRTLDLLPRENPADHHERRLTLWSSGEPKRLQEACTRWLNESPPSEALPAQWAGIASAN